MNALSVRPAPVLKNGGCLVFSLGHDQVAVAGQRVGPRVLERVDGVEILLQEVLAVRVFVDDRLGQRDGHVRRGRAHEVVVRVEQLDHRVAGVEGVGVLVIADRAFAVARGDVVGDVVGAVLHLGVAEVRVELRRSALACDVRIHLLAEGVPLAGEHDRHPAGEEVGRARAVRAQHRDDRLVRQLRAVDLGDRGIVPVRDRPGEDLHQDLRGQPQVADQVAAHGQVVHEGGPARRVGDVGVAPWGHLGAGARQLVLPVAERRVRAGEVDLAALDVIRPALCGAVRVVVDGQALGLHVVDPLGDRDVCPRRARAVDRRVAARTGHHVGEEQPERGDQRDESDPGRPPPEQPPREMPARRGRPGRVVT